MEKDNKTINISEDVLKNTVSEIVKTEIENFETKIKDDMQREIKSNLTPSIMTPKVEIKSDYVDKNLLGTFARLSAKSYRDRVKFSDTLDTVKDSYLRSAIDKVMTFASASDGGLLVPTQFSPTIIDSLRATSVIRQAGVNVVPMPNNNISLRKWSDGTGEATWEGENTKPTATDGGSSLLSLSGKKLIAEVEVSNELINDTSGLADQYIQNMLIYKIANKEDKTFISGTGIGNVPKGIINAVDSNNSFAMTATPTFAKAKADIIKMVQYVRKNNVMLAKAGFVMSPSNFYKLQSAEAPNNSTADFFKTLTNMTLFGFPVYITTNIADDTIIFGDFSMAVIGEAQGITITASTDYKFGEDITVVKAISREDFGLYHDLAFSVLTGVTWSTALS